MSSPPLTARRRRRRISDAVLVTAVMALVILVQVTTQLFNGLELKLYDVASTRTARQPSDRIAIIAIDDTSIANIGRWPWPREVHAQLIDQLTQAGAKTIAHTAFFFEPQTDRGPEQPAELARPGAGRTRSARTGGPGSGRPRAPAGLHRASRADAGLRSPTGRQHRSAPGA